MYFQWSILETTLHNTAKRLFSQEVAMFSGNNVTQNVVDWLDREIRFAEASVSTQILGKRKIL